jgi:hypothetical protein
MSAATKRFFKMMVEKDSEERFEEKEGEGEESGLVDKVSLPPVPSLLPPAYFPSSLSLLTALSFFLIVLPPPSSL